MTIDWSSLALVAAVGATAALSVATLVALAIVGLPARPDPVLGAVSPSAAGRAVAGLCLLAVATIVGYGLYVIAA